MTQIQAQDSFITVSPGGHYAEACQRFGLCKSGQHLVVSFAKWNKWYNEQRFARVWIKPPAPAFCGDNYQIAHEVATDLNDWKENA